MASMALFSTTSFGQEEKKGWGDKAAPELSPLTVTGAKAAPPSLSPGLKTSLPVDSLPKSVSVMNADQIKAQGLKSVGDIIDYTPGVTNSQGEGHRDAAVIRGVRTTQDFYRDGIRDDVQYYRPLYNIEQVEFIRGSDALLSGFGGGYGLINRVSKKGKIGEDFTTVDGSIDTFGETNVQLDKNFNLNDSTAFRVNLFLENLENHRDFYYGDGFGVNPVLKYDLGDGSTLDLSYEYLDQERFIDRGIPTGANGKPVQSLKDIVFGDATENFSTHEAHIFRAIFEHELTDSLEGRLSASHSSHDKLYQNLYVPDSWKVGTVSTNGYDAAANTVALDGYVDTTQRKTSIFSYDVSGQVETGSLVHNLVVGIEYLDTQNDNDRYNAAWLPNNNGDGDTEIFSIQRRMDISGGTGENSAGTSVTNYYSGANSNLNDRTFADVSVLSFYINDEIALMDSLKLLLGVRFDDMRFDVSGTTNGEDRDFTTSPRAGLTFDVTNEAMLYAAYSESFAPKAGDQYAKLGSTHSSLDPDTFENIEFGVKYDLPMGLTLSAAYFEVEANKPELIGSTLNSQMVTSEVTGFELQLLGSLTDKWFLSAAYTDLDAQNSSGSRLRESPESMFSLWNNYLVSDRLAVNLGIIYQDESLTNTGGTSTLPDYTRVDVGASYGLTDNTRVRLHVENLFDEVYFPHSHSKHQASVGAPIHATFGITSSF
jgi:catecholate siderophore receptor